MRWFLAVGLMLAGCYSPHLGSPSFYCHPDDVPACPDGQKCVAERCVADSGSSSMPDLANPAPQPDLAAPMCQPTGGPCPNKNDAICCSKYCVYSTSKCK